MKVRFPLLAVLLTLWSCAGTPVEKCGYFIGDVYYGCQSGAMSQDPAPNPSPRPSDPVEMHVTSPNHSKSVEIKPPPVN